MRQWAIAVVGGAMLGFAAPCAAQEGGAETRQMDEGQTSPAATLDQMEWLVGRWGGPGIGGAAAMESWLPITGDVMVGTFVQEDGAGGVMFTEHMYLRQDGDTLSLHIKHFGADMIGWEAQDEMESFPLVAIEHCAAYFAGLTVRCEGEDGLRIAVRTQGEEGAQELLFRFTRMD